MAIMCDLKHGTLAKMAEDFLGVKLDKNWEIRASDWEATNLTDRQINYAAKDAFVAIDLFKYFSDKLVPTSFFVSSDDQIKKVVEKCTGNLNKKFLFS